MAYAKKRVWLPLDNAAKIFPATLRSDWSNVFRLSVTLTHTVDSEALSRAVERTARRFPSVCVSLKRGLFWYYLEENRAAPTLKEEGCQPLLPMTRKEIGKCAVRILYYEERIAAEFFHALTDGTGALVFMKTLTAAYLQEAQGVEIPCEEGILSLEEEPRQEELEDAFLRYAGGRPSKREMSSAFHLLGQPEKDGFLHVTSFSLAEDDLIAAAREKGVTVNTYLVSALVFVLCRLQKEKVAASRERAVRVQIPVNLRRLFPSNTMRNFVCVFNVGVERGFTDVAFDEVLHLVHHQVALYSTPKNLRAIFTANVESEKGIAIRLVPLFLKNLVMRAVFNRVGESSACLCLSNLGRLQLPEPMRPYVEQMDFIIGPQARAPYNCAVVSWNGVTRLNVVRNSREPELERELYEFFVERGFDPTLESNER